MLASEEEKWSEMHVQYMHTYAMKSDEKSNEIWKMKKSSLKYVNENLIAN